MLIRKHDEVKNVQWGNGTSHRFLLEADGMGYTLTDTIVKAGTKSLIEYEPPRGLLLHRGQGFGDRDGRHPST